jgi:hypothetical protein
MSNALNRDPAATGYGSLPMAISCKVNDGRRAQFFVCKGTWTNKVEMLGSWGLGGASLLGVLTDGDDLAQRKKVTDEIIPSHRKNTIQKGTLRADCLGQTCSAISNLGTIIRKCFPIWSWKSFYGKNLWKEYKEQVRITCSNK